MDFSFTEEQDELGGLARQILENEVTVEVLRETEAGSERFHRPTWQAMAGANLLGIGVSEAAGGSGFGIIEQGRIAEEVGRTVAPVPFVASTVLGAATLGAFGSPAHHERWVRPAVEGSVVLTAALAEPSNRTREAPTTRAVPDGDGFRLTGAKTCVPAATYAGAVLVPAVVEGRDEAVVFVVEPSAEGVSVEPQRVTNRDVEGLVTLDGVRVRADDAVGGVDGGAAVLARMLQHGTVALCAEQLGVIGRALEMTAAYTTDRVQFDRPVATFQAVATRAADAYIDVEGARLTLIQAAWRLSEGLPAATEVEVAKFWAAEAGHRVAHAAVHLHGGTGIDEDYPLHRYFIAAKHHEFTLGSATDQLLRIGADLASSPD